MRMVMRTPEHVIVEGENGIVRARAVGTRPIRAMIDNVPFTEAIVQPNATMTIGAWSFTIAFAEPPAGHVAAPPRAPVASRWRLFVLLPIAAALMMLLGTGSVPGTLLPFVLALTGFSHGVTGPARDMLVRAATPPGASGKVFGFAYSGLDLGSCLTPLAFGWLLDHADARWLFVAVGTLMLCTIGTVVQVRRSAQPAPVSA